MNKTSIITASAWVILISLCLYFVFYREYVKVDTWKNKEIEKLDSIVNSLREQNTELSRQVEMIKNDITISNTKVNYYNNKRKEVKEKSHETITNVSKYSNDQLDSFFSKRYEDSH